MDLFEVNVELTYGLRREVLGWITPATRIDDDGASHLILSERRTWTR